jgi:hypothetical protein
MTAGGCCSRKTRKIEMDALDRRGYVDPVAVERAVYGQPIGRKVNAAEAEAIIVRLAQTRRWGLSNIASHTGYSRSQVAVVLAKHREIR